MRLTSLHCITKLSPYAPRTISLSLDALHGMNSNELKLCIFLALWGNFHEIARQTYIFKVYIWNKLYIKTRPSDNGRIKIRLYLHRWAQHAAAFDVRRAFDDKAYLYLYVPICFHTCIYIGISVQYIVPLTFFIET